MRINKYTYECIYDKGTTINIFATSTRLANTKLKNTVKSILTFKLVKNG